MELLSACYYRHGKNAVSLLVQKYKYRQVPILFACICMGEEKDAGRAGGYMTEQILQWFRRISFKRLYQNQEKGMERLEESLCETIQETDRELESSKIMTEDKKVNLSGIFCIDDRYLILRRGSGRICLINRAFGRVHIQHMHRQKERNEIIMEQGILQRDIGVLFTMESFFQYITDEMIRNGLAVSEVSTEEQMDRHLKELGRESERLGRIETGIILLRTQ